MIQVLITDDHPVVRQGIRQILEDDNEKRFGIIDEAASGKEMIEKILIRNYDIIFLDISLPGRSGLELIPDIKRIRKCTAVLMVSIYPEEQYAIRALKLGASGYLTKSSAPEELIAAAIKVAGGGRYITSSLAEKITNNILEENEKPLYESLSARELDVVKLLGEGNTLNEIAIRLSISPKTISTYRRRILEKLGIKTTAGIIKFAIENQLTY
jgi:DNA-binding NarL/FixJ family response regulator